MQNVLVIVGNGPTREQAPHSDLSRDVWTMNNHILLWEKRTCAVFEMHPDALNTPRYDETYKTWLRQYHPFPIYMHERHEEIPASQKFPRGAIGGLYGQHLFKGDKPIIDFYTSTFPYMMALGLYLNYRRVELYGVDLHRDSEYALHRDSVFFWIGKATTLGVDVWISDKSQLYDTAIYPMKLPKRGL